ncbi:MAG: peptidylprolyl isomerase [Nitrospinae bacterium]|nr:peptidylprolyl isomerase [Nitrospinota bacterium]
MLTAPARAEEAIDSIAAEVNGEIVLLSEVKERQFQMRAMGADEGLTGADLSRRALDGLIEEKLVIQFGKDREEYKVADMEVDQAVNEMKKRVEAQGGDILALLSRSGLTMERYRLMLKDQILARKVIGNEVRGQVKIPEESAREYYEQHGAEFAGRRSARISHILKFVPKKGTEADWRKAYDEIAALRDKIAAGLDFAQAAKEHSDDPSRDTGGDLGEVVQGEMVEEFENVAFALEPGIVSAPVKSPFGYHLILVKEKLPATAAPFEKVKGEIENKMFGEMIQAVREDWLRRVKKDAFIDVKARF